MTSPLISTAGVSKKYCRTLRRSLRYAASDLAGELLGRPHGGGDLRQDEFWALRDVSFELAEGECVGLIGHNGAGKTTLLKVLNGLIKPDAGRVEVRGRMVALIALGAGFNPVLTGRENIYVSAAIFGMSKREVDTTLEDIIRFSELEEFIDAPVQSYSSGMVVRLGFAIAVHARPDILVLDEVLAVGDIGFQIKCYNTLSRLRREGVGFVLVSHNMHQISRFADRTMYLNRGTMMHYGNNVDSIAAYMRDSIGAYESLGGGAAADAPAGTGTVLLRNPRFLDSDGSVIASIDAGQPVVFAIDFLCATPDVGDATLDLLIKDSTGTVYQGTHVFATPDNPLPAHGCFEVAFGVMPCNVHALFFSCALICATNVEILDCLFDIRLDVNPNPLNHASLVLPVTFSIRPEVGSGAVI